ncbi:MAG: diphosphomevalonate decarboxylase [Proteobacteria bacterium]|nr:diphosphomevalonate decarboxylase [Pseudomonadota bacterium]
MRATAIAQPNIALIKYWGKRDVVRNLPAVGSISITLSELQTQMSVDLDTDLPGDVLLVNGGEEPRFLPRISACLNDLLGEQRSFARISSHSNFPMAAGLASSASAFSALTMAAAGAADLSLSTRELARIAGRASGSAARSLYGGFVELKNDGDSIELESLMDAESWPLQVVLAITDTGRKETGSTEAMEISRKTSPFYDDWIVRQATDLDAARTAIEQRDFAGLAAIAEHNCLKMHSIMWASRPPIVYWKAATMRCLQTVRRLQGEGRSVFFTIDAGPQVKAVCLPEDTEVVREALSTTPGVKQVMTSGLGAGARLVKKT